MDGERPGRFATASNLSISLLGVSFAGPAIREWPKMFRPAEIVADFVFATVRFGDPTRQSCLQREDTAIPYFLCL